MKKILKALGALVLILVLLGLYICYSTGYFRKIENTFDGKIIKEVQLPGVEDMQVSYTDDFILLSSDDRASRRDTNPQQGHLYYIDLQDASLEPVQLTTDFDKPLYPHGISMIQLDTQVYRLFVINHVGRRHTIEVFNLYNDSLVHLRSLHDSTMVSPNDVVALDGDRFYFTNDHGYTEGMGKLAEDYLGWPASNVVYHDGENYKVVAEKIAYANGINYEAKRNLLFVASPRSFAVKVYQPNEDGSLNFIENINCGTGVDNIEIANDGRLWIGCHPNLLAFVAYAKGQEEIAPSEVIAIDYRGTGDYSQEMILMDDGAKTSAASAACIYNNLLFVGNVMDDHFLILERQ